MKNHDQNLKNILLLFNIQGAGLPLRGVYLTKISQGGTHELRDNQS